METRMGEDRAVMDMRSLDDLKMSWTVWSRGSLGRGLMMGAPDG